jgi:Fur family ferric uptake transcriptional regulator
VSIAEKATVIRSTRQRVAVAALLDELGDFCSAQEVYEQLRKRGERIGLTTVYRALQLLAEEERVDVLRGGDGETTYRRCSTGHHHHLVCRKCGRTVEVQGAEMERWADRIANDHDFVDIEHSFEIYGTCRDCAQG